MMRTYLINPVVLIVQGGMREGGMGLITLPGLFGMGFANDARPRHQLLESLAFLVDQMDDILGFLTIERSLPQVPMRSDVSYNTSNLSKQSG